LLYRIVKTKTRVALPKQIGRKVFLQTTGVKKDIYQECGEETNIRTVCSPLLFITIKYINWNIATTLLKSRVFFYAQK
jgi:hypothetical protein